MLIFVNPDRLYVGKFQNDLRFIRGVSYKINFRIIGNQGTETY